MTDEPTKLGRTHRGRYYGRMATFDHVDEADDWTSRAKCRDMDVSEADLMFHPSTPNGNFPALRFCTGKDGQGACPVQSECLAYILGVEAEERYRHGVWGGTTPKQRHDMCGTREPA